MNKTKKKDFRTKAFTLVELLTVIAIIGILAAILFPVVGKVRESAGETAARAQFSQWGQAFELFRQDYGFYPSFGDTVNDFYINKAGDADNPPYDGNEFLETLTGRVVATGDRVESGDDGFEAGNRRAASFYTFGEGEVEMNGTTPVVRDQLGNGDIVVLFDLNQDGIVQLSNGNNPDYTGFAAGSLPKVRSAKSDLTFEITADQIPDTGVRAGVIFYSAGYGNRLLTSW